jgi:hypothetical protein
MEKAKNLKQVHGLKDQLKTIEKIKKGNEALDKVPIYKYFPQTNLALDMVNYTCLKDQV